MTTVVKLRETKLGRLLANAFRDEPPFREWLLKRIAEVVPEWRIEALHLMQVRDDWPEPRLDNRRSDLWAALSEHADRSCCSHLLLGELKIAAPFDEGQAEDYQKRAIAAANRNVCNPTLCRTCVTILIAPQRYIASHASDANWFHATLSLETIKEFFDDPPAGIDPATEDRYVVYRTTIATALSDAAAGNVPLRSQTREGQFRWYRQFAEEYKPNLHVHELPGSEQSYDIQFDLPIKGFGYIKHRLFDGKVVIELTRWMRHHAALGSFLEKFGKGRLTVEYPPKARATPSNLYIRDIRATVKRLSKLTGFAEQEDAVISGIDAADVLFRWVEEHKVQILKFIGSLKSGVAGGKV